MIRPARRCEMPTQASIGSPSTSIISTTGIPDCISIAREASECSSPAIITPDGRQERLEELKRLFPDLFTNEGKLNPDELKQLIEPNEIHEAERYEFKWYGKAASKREAFTPTTATLVYDEARSVKPELADGNMIIEGDNLEALKLLQATYFDAVADLEVKIVGFCKADFFLF